MTWIDPFPDMAKPKMLPEVAYDGTDHGGLIPPDHMQRIHAGLARFRQQHGRRLMALGWNRDNLFLGTTPEQARFYDDLHGMAAILANGAELIHADQDRLEFDANGMLLGWFKAGFWLAGQALIDHLKRIGN
ncbi:MAG: hypothetical protein HQL93_02445 [Magnetococcales bacterium]|nr:hypothetical protein [Magnetococcales bacterium]